MNKKDLAEKAYSQAKNYFLEFGCCPQCVLLAVKETAGYVTNDIIKAAHTLSGGEARLGSGTCGAISGGLLALGAKFGRGVDSLNQANFQQSFSSAKELIERVKEEFEGAYSCNDFQIHCHGRTYDMWNPEERNQLKTADFKNYCAHITGKIAQWCVEMMTNDY